MAMVGFFSIVLMLWWFSFVLLSSLSLQTPNKIAQHIAKNNASTAAGCLSLPASLFCTAGELGAEVDPPGESDLDVIKLVPDGRKPGVRLVGNGEPLLSVAVGSWPDSVEKGLVRNGTENELLGPVCVAFAVVVAGAVEGGAAEARVWVDEGLGGTVVLGEAVVNTEFGDVMGAGVGMGIVDGDDVVEGDGTSLLCDVVEAGVEDVGVEVAAAVPFFTPNPTRWPS
jgi:hypothetical protein